MKDTGTYKESPQPIKIAYIHATSFPSTEANTFDAIWTADALTEKADVTFFVPRLKTSLARLKEYYEISGTRLKLVSMRLNLVPDRVLLKFRSTYENLLSLYLRFHPAWRRFRGQKILYVREPRELHYWGERRSKREWMKDWILCYEAHDTLGLDPAFFLPDQHHAQKDREYTEKEARTLAAAKNFDLMICNTQTLADDMRAWSRGSLDPQVLTLASPLPRLDHAPIIHFGETITIGYIGTVDKFRGVDLLLESIKLLRKRYSLRVVGRFREEKGVDPAWLNAYLDDPALKNRLDINLVKQIEDVASEIDRCDIVVQPASSDVLDARYAAPLKSYGYMVRGKPIVAGDVHCHRELFSNGQDAVLYPLSPEGLADCIQSIGDNPNFAQSIAEGAWKKSEIYNLPRKVTDLLSIISETQAAREIDSR